MGEAARRGNYEQRKEQAIREGRIKKNRRRAILHRDFKQVFIQKEERRPVILIGGAHPGLAIKNAVNYTIKQPGENRKEHKPI